MSGRCAGSLFLAIYRGRGSGVGIGTGWRRGRGMTRYLGFVEGIQPEWMVYHRDKVLL